MSKVVNETYETEKHDPALDSGVCPSPNESYQSYFEAFPALSSPEAKTKSKKTLLDITDEYFDAQYRNKLYSFNKTSSRLADKGFSPLSWQFAKRPFSDDSSRTSSASWPTQKRAQLSSPTLFHSNVKEKSFYNAPSPTNVDVTPNKRQKVVQHFEKYPISDDVSPSSTFNERSPNFQLDNSNKDNVSISTNHCRQCHPRSCPDLSSSPTNGNGASCRRCPTCSAGNTVGAKVEFHWSKANQTTDGLLANSIFPAFSSSSPRSTSPHFVVPKSFHIGSWPLKNSDFRAYGDVPFWPCSEWFCTEHKSLQFGLIAAKAQQEPAKFLAPQQQQPHYYSQHQIDDWSSAVPVNVAVAAGSAALPTDDVMNDDDDDYAAARYCENMTADDESALPNDVALDDDDWSDREGENNQSAHVDAFDSPSPVVVYFDESVTSEIDDWRKRKPFLEQHVDDKETAAVAVVKQPLRDESEEYASSDVSDESMTFDAPQFILHIINENETGTIGDDAKTYYKEVDPNCTLAPASPWKNEPKANAGNLIDLDTYWPGSIDKSSSSNFRANPSVPEFELFPSALSLHVAPPAHHCDDFLNAAQEIGFCLPKFDFSTSTVDSTNLKPQFPPLKAKQKSQLACSINVSDEDKSLNRPGSTTKKSPAVAVPISPDTHFVPIRSESMEDAYILKPYFDDTFMNMENIAAIGKNVSYIEDSDYYVYLEPDKAIDALNCSDESTQSCIGKVPKLKTSKVAPNHTEKPAVRNALLRQLGCLSQNTKKADQYKVEEVFKKSPIKEDSSASKSTICSSLPLKFRAIKPGKMVQTEEKYFLDRNDSTENLPDLDPAAAENNNSNNNNAADMSKFDFGQLLFSGGTNWAGLLGINRFQFDRLNNNDNNSYSNYMVNNSSSSDGDEDKRFYEKGFQIWVPIARKMTPVADEMRWPSSADIKRQLDLLNDNFTTSKFAPPEKDDAREMKHDNDGSSLKSSFSTPSMQQQTAKHQLTCPGAQFGSCSTKNSKTVPLMQNLRACGSGGDTEKKIELEMLKKQDKRDEEMLLKYVSNISLVSPLDTPSLYDDSSSNF